MLPLAAALLVATLPAAPCDGRELCLESGDLGVWPTATLRTGYEAQQPDPEVEFIGRNDGFRLDQARLGFNVSHGPWLRAQLIADGARLLPGSEPNDPLRPLTLALVDAWVEVAPSPYFQIRAGQTRMPADREGLTARASMIFATRSVAASGVEPGRGFALRGLSASRDLGVVVGAPDAALGDFTLDYRLAIATGAGGNRSANDNKLPAAFARFGATWADRVGAALGGAWNRRTVGEVPEQQSEDELTGFLELSGNAFGLDLLALAHARYIVFDTALPEPTDENRTRLGFGATSWLVYELPLFSDLFSARSGYRISFLEPPVAVPDVTLLEHALAVRLDSRGLPVPVSLIVDFTSLWQLDELGVRTFGGNRVFGLVQVAL